MRSRPGAFYHPDDPESGPTRHARALFLDRVEVYAPEVLAGLIAVLPLYADAVPHVEAIHDALLAGMEPVEAMGHDDEPVLEEPEVEPAEVYGAVMAGEEPGPDLSPAWAEIRPFRAALAAWADRMNMRADWVIEAAFETLGFWHIHGPSDPPAWRYPQGTLLFGRTPFRFSHPGWWVRAQSRGDIADEIRGAFERELREYLGRADSALTARGWVHTPQKTAEHHFEWLVRYQVQGWTHSQIARSYHAGRRTVGDGLADAAQAVGLSLRPPGKAGRPRKEK